MKSIEYAIILGLALLMSGCGNKGNKSENTGIADEKTIAPDSFSLKNNDDSLSYALGYNIGKQYAGMGVNLNPVAYTKAIEDGLAGTNPLLDENEVLEVMSAFQHVLQKKNADLQANKKAEQIGRTTKFLDDNKMKPGVVELPGGLQYKVLQEGAGIKPTPEDEVSIHILTSLMDGHIIQNSRERGGPYTVKISALIPAWQQVLPLMKEGATYRIWAPPSFAYGENGISSGVGPHDAIIFEIELVKVVGRE